jgi:hypothetical protein
MRKKIKRNTQFEINTSESYYLFPDGCHKTIIDLIDDWLREIKQAGKLNVVMEKVISFPNGTYLKTPELSIKVNAVHIKGSLVTGSMEKVEFRWEDRISLIMKVYF